MEVKWQQMKGLNDPEWERAMDFADYQGWDTPEEKEERKR
jgi:hypothetical protein